MPDRVFACCDRRTIAAPIERCFAVLGDLETYARWWTLVSVVPLGTSWRLAAGVRFRFAGARPAGSPAGWTAEVRSVTPPHRIDLAYVDGDLLGDTAWELDTDEGATTVAYRYLGVRPNAETSRRSFARWGTELHSLAMQLDALAGLERYLTTGAVADDAWRADVGRQVADGLRGMGR